MNGTNYTNKKFKAQDLRKKFLFIPLSMTYRCNYGTSSSSFKYTLKNVLHHHSIASALLFFPILFFFLKALHLDVSSYVTKIQNL